MGYDLIIPPEAILYLSADPAKIRAQLKGARPDPATLTPLRADVSTDEIAPGWICFYYDETLGEHVYTGLRGVDIAPGEIRAQGFRALVSGPGHGCGSSRETAPYGEMAAGIRLVWAPSFGPIYAQNARNLGLHLSSDPELLAALQRGDALPLEAFTRGLDPIATAVVRAGGLSALSRARMAERANIPPRPDRPPRPDIPSSGPPRPQNAVEKILRAHASGPPPEALSPGDGLFVRADLRFTHDYVTAMARAQFRAAFGEDARIRDPGSVVAYRDHLTFLGEALSPEARARGLGARADHLAEVQAAFAAEQGIGYVGEAPEGGSEAICHTHVLETLALPGQVIVGTDSHTCTAGAVGAFAFGVGSTDMANAWFTGDVQVRVPEAVEVWVTGRLGPIASAKDAMLTLLATPFVRGGGARGRALLFKGPGLEGLGLDERATLSNMAVEAGALTALIAPDEGLVQALAAARGISALAVRAGVVACDADATFAARIPLDLGAVEPLVATPGDPKNGIPLSALPGPVAIDIAYGGSCTGGKAADMDAYAEVLAWAQGRGLRVAPGVRLYLQMGSQGVRRYAEARGYVALFEAVGAEVIPPSCGACIRAGPGVSEGEGEITLSAINRNFPGRSGPGQVYLASPRVVALGAILGRIPTYDDLQGVTCEKGV